MPLQDRRPSPRDPAPGRKLEGRTGHHGNRCCITSAGKGRATRQHLTSTLLPAGCPLEERRRICMDLETAIQAFGSAGHDLPRDTMQWALDHWDEAAPGLLDVLGRYTSGADQSDQPARAVFFILHLAGGRHDTRVFPLLCRLAQD